MRRARLRRLALAAFLACAISVSATLGAAATPSGEQPVPGDLDFSGMFERNQQAVALRTVRGATGGGMVVQFSGSAPATCRRQGKTVTPAYGGTIQILGYTRGAPIAPGGTFTFRLRPRPQDLEGGLPRFDVTIRGTFHGNNVVGRVRGTSGKGGSFDSCKADARFWAWRNQ